MSPNTLFICHLVAMTEIRSTRSMRKRRPREHINPFDTTEMDSTVGLPNELTMNRNSQGRGNLKKRVTNARDRRSEYPMQMSKRLEPMELDTAMSPRPLRATITLNRTRTLRQGSVQIRPRDEVRYAGAGSKNGQPHHFRGDAQREANRMRPPNHEVREESDP